MKKLIILLLVLVISCSGRRSGIDNGGNGSPQVKVNEATEIEAAAIVDFSAVLTDAAAAVAIQVLGIPLCFLFNKDNPEKCTIKGNFECTEDGIVATDKDEELTDNYIKLRVDEELDFENITYDIKNCLLKRTDTAYKRNFIMDGEMMLTLVTEEPILVAFKKITIKAEETSNVLECTNGYLTFEGLFNNEITAYENKDICGFSVTTNDVEKWVKDTLTSEE
jgi:hypothetical protein